VRVYYKPFVSWIWGGAFLMALGGIIAVTDRRYRLARRDAIAPATNAPTAAAQGA
jgi:cytochrome c-type biogenesis protein CcmF